MNLSSPVRDFDIDVLRSLVAVSDLGGLAQAGRQRGRTVAALSLQMRKLEDQAGADLFFKEGRRLALTSNGEVVLSYARRILALNDEAQMSLRSSSVSGLVRLGTSQDFGEAWLPPILAQFRQQFPAVGLEVSIDRSSQLVQAVDDGSLDMVLTMGMGERPNSVCVGHLPLVWIAHRDFEWDRSAPLPLAVFPTPCRFRAKANAELDAAGIPWNIALTSSSLYGIWAAVSARLGVTLRTVQGLLPELEVVDGKFGLPNLGHVDVSLTMASQSRPPALASLMGMLHESLRMRILELGGQLPRAAA
jgi:DNA-binding transcriptional LysR family regulator